MSSSNSKEPTPVNTTTDVQLTIMDVQNNLEQLKFQFEQNNNSLTCFRHRKPTRKNILKVFSELKGLELYQYDIFSIRYIPLYKEYQLRCTFYAIMFHLMRSVVTVGSITVPALLSLQTSSSSTGTNWLVWAISLAVTISNGILTLFKVDKKYYFIHTTKSLLESEGWQYIALTGKYSHINDETIKQNSHAHQFAQFSFAIEKIKMRQVEEEYYKSQETSGSTVASTTKPGPSLNDMREMFHSVLIQSGYSPSPNANASSEMKAWMETVLDKTNKIIVGKSTN